MKRNDRRICYEMQKLRNMLDEKGIKWTDMSDEYDDPFGGWFIHRTHFDYAGKHISVVHGYGTYGGLTRLDETDPELLEMWIQDGNHYPEGWMTAEEVMMTLEACE